MNSYLLTIVVKPEITDESRKTLLESMVKRLVGDGGNKGDMGNEGKVIKEDLWGVRDLAYPIKRSSKGFFAHFEIETDPKNAKGLDKSLKVEEDILRYLLVRTK